MLEYEKNMRFLIGTLKKQRLMVDVECLQFQNKNYKEIPYPNKLNTKNLLVSNKQKHRSRKAVPKSKCKIK